jgi:predicted nucleotidyltransferase
MNSGPEILNILKQHNEELKTRFGLSGLVLYGSYAKGNQQPDSDIDLLYELPEGSHMPLMRLQKLQNYISNLLAINKVEVVNRKYINPVVLKDVQQYAITIF